MPKEAARIWLKVTDVRVERLQDITNDECVKEGIYPSNCRNCNATFGCDLCPDEGYDEVNGITQDSMVKVKRGLPFQMTWNITIPSRSRVIQINFISSGDVPLVIME